jgi:hypothetical protein
VSDTSTAVAREVAWLNTTIADGLPVLPSSAGGPWQVIQGYWARTPATQKTSIFVLRSEIQDVRFSNIRIMPGYEFTLKLVWPIRTNQTPLAETEQQNLDSAVELLLRRIRGPIGDKTHGGAFLSVGEAPRNPGVHVVFADPEHTIAAEKALTCEVSYHADDFDFNG